MRGNNSCWTICFKNYYFVHTFKVSNRRKRIRYLLKHATHFHILKQIGKICTLALATLAGCVLFSKCTWYMLSNYSPLRCDCEQSDEGVEYNVEVFPVGVVNRFRVPHSVCLKICVLCSGHDNLNTNSNGQTVCNVRSLAAYT